MSQTNPKLIDLDFTPELVKAAAAEASAPSDLRNLMNQLQQTAFELRHRLAAVENERNDLASKVSTLETSAPVSGAAASPAAAPVAPASNAPAALEALQAQNLDLSRTAERLRRALTEAEKRGETLQSQLAGLRMARDAAQDRARDAAQKLEQVSAELEELRDSAPADPTPSPAEAPPAEDAAAALLRESKQERSRHLEKTLELQSELSALRERCQELEDIQAVAAAAGAGPPEYDQLRQENRELSVRLEAQRRETIDLATRLHGAQEQLKTVSVTLAELRLQALAAPGRPAELPSLQVEAPSLPPLPAALAAPEPFPLAEAQKASREMRRCYQAYVRTPEDVSHLNELHCLVHTFAEAAQHSALTALHGISAGLAVLLQELYHFPEQITPDALATVLEGLEFLATALKLRDPRQLHDPAALEVVVVDDDPATCECIIMAMESVSMKAGSFNEPAKALCELADRACDLIVLDVQMPGLDGFELCAAVRELAHHKNTPILFVTGLGDPEVRARSILSGGNAFMMKPFMLCELALRGLLLTAKAQLHLA